jgi:hypothetical protein
VKQSSRQNSSQPCCFAGDVQGLVILKKQGPSAGHEFEVQTCSFEPASNPQSENKNLDPNQLLKSVATRKSSSFKCECDGS